MYPQTQGILAVWSDISAEALVDYRHWLTREHMAERVGVDGFIAGRMFRSLDPTLRRYCMLYELQAADVLAGESYLARQNAPTPWSQRIMPQLQQFRRGGGTVLSRAGRGAGGVISPMRLALSKMQADPHALVNDLARMPGICAAWLMQVDAGVTGVPTREKSMRTGGQEHGFEALLVLEAVDELSLTAACVLATDRLELAWDGSVPEQFGLCFALDRRSAGLPAED